MDKATRGKINLDEFLFKGLENLWIKGRNCTPVDIKDCVETVKRAIELYGYRKLPKDKPPLIKLPRVCEFIEEDAEAYVEGYADGASAQRKADIKHYEY